MEITAALERYDRHIPFFTGEVTLPAELGLTLRPLEIGETAMRRDGLDRHHRMLAGLEFDVCEMSLGSYVLGLSRDAAFPMVGVPVFPRRYFSMSQIMINRDAGIERPQDLRGKKVGINAFQVTLSVLAKGDLEADYGVRWQEIEWYCMRPEQLPIEFPPAVSVQRIPEGAEIGEMLVSGALDALITPQRPARTDAALAAGGDRVRRLFANPEEEDRRYYKKHGFFPVMHLLVIRRDVAERQPALAGALIEAWEAAKRIAATYYDDQNFSIAPWAVNALRTQRATLADDIWPSGLKTNRANLQIFLDYCAAQGLMERPLSVEDLFDPTVRNS